MSIEQGRISVIRDLIMDAIADDFESFDTIHECVNRWDSEDMNIHPDNSEIEKALFQLLEAGLADAYILTNTNKKIELSDISSANLKTFYFYLSPEGLRDLRTKS